MKFQPVTKSIEMFGHSEVSNMTIEASGKMFRTIISGLYSRKIESICRESIANAKDGHIKRGNPERPSFVHAPTTWEPFYSVRDFGCSMDHETVMRRFTAIGWSSKEDSNDEIGTFGLGSKAPFAYTSMFSVTTWLDGVQRTYDAFLNEEGKPMMALASEAPSDEEQGLMVRFDVRAPDVHAFHKAIRFVALAHTPCFESNLENVRSASIEEDHGAFYFSRDVQDGPRVQIGCVTYPIDFSVLDSTREMQILRNSNSLVLRTKIGDLGVVPSREGLEYTDKTLTNLTGYLTNLFTGYAQEVEQRCAALTNVWEAAAYWDEISGHPIRRAVGTWTRVLDKAFTLDQTESFVIRHGLRHNIKKLVCQSERSASLRDAGVFARRGKMVVYVEDERSARVKFWRRRVAIDMDARGLDEAMLVMLPDATAAVARLKTQLTLTKADRNERKQKLSGVFVNTAKMRADLKQAIDTYGCPQIIALGDLPEPPRAVRNPKEAAIATYRLGRSSDSFDRDDRLVLADDEFNLVFPLKRGKFERPIAEGVRFVKRMAQSKGFGVALGIGVSVSNVKRYLAENPAAVIWTDVFNADTFDIAALKERADKLASKKVMTLDDHQTLYHGVLNHLTGVDLPDSLAAFMAQYHEMSERRRADAKAREELKAAGPALDDCVAAIRLITGESYEPNGLTEEDRSLDALVARIEAEFPHLQYTIDERRQYGDAAVPPAVYVLGQIAHARLFPPAETIAEAPTETIIAPDLHAKAA